MTNKEVALLNLYKEVERATNNFKGIRPELLIKNPKWLLVFRLLLNKDQRSLAKMLNKSQGTIWSLETGVIKQMNPKDAQKIAELTKPVGIVEAKVLLERYNDISQRGKFYGDYAKRMRQRAPNDISIRSAIAQAPTSQEEELMQELKKQGIKFQFHGKIVASRTFVVDFIFPSENNPKIFLEMKDLPSNYLKRLMAVELAYRAIKIKKKHPKIKAVAIIKGNLQNNAYQIIKEEYDKVLLNTPLHEVLKTLKQFSD